MRLVVSRTAVRLVGVEPFRREFLRPLLLGAVDGLITSFAIISGGLASAASSRSVLRIGLSSLVADGLSMGASETISSKAHDRSLPRAALRGAACFVSFAVAGSVPIAGYAIGIRVGFAALALSALAFASCLVSVGIAKSVLLEESLLCGVFEIATVGALAGLVAYGVASLR